MSYFSGIYGVFSGFAPAARAKSRLAFRGLGFALSVCTRQALVTKWSFLVAIMRDGSITSILSRTVRHGTESCTDCAADGHRKTHMRISGRMQALTHEGRAPTLWDESSLTECHLRQNDYRNAWCRFNRVSN